MILKTRGTGKDRNFKKIGKNVVIEPSVLVFEPEHIEIGDNVYIGHNTMLHGYYKNKFKIGSNVFISAGCNIYGSCGLVIEDDVGLGPNVIILGTAHELKENNLEPINKQPLIHKPIRIRRGSDIGMGSIILGGVNIGKGTQIGAGSVVTADTGDYSIMAGVPAKLLRNRYDYV